MKTVQPADLQPGDRTIHIVAADRRGGTSFRATVVRVEAGHYGNGNLRVTAIPDGEDNTPYNYSWPPGLGVAIE